jgi:hypothetical protein
MCVELRRMRYYAPVDQLMLIMGPLHTLEATAYKKAPRQGIARSACMRLPFGHGTHRAIDVPIGFMRLCLIPD